MERISGRECCAIYISLYLRHPYRLIEKVGKEEFNNRLDSIFTEARKSIFGGGKSSYMLSAGVQSPYNHGNQPSLHISLVVQFLR